MTVKEAIARIRAINLEQRLTKLTEIGAPEIILKNTQELLFKAQTGDIKVKGLERKHPVADLEVFDLYQATAKGHYYKEGNKVTVILKMVTAAGTFYYDYFDNKIGASQIELNATVAENKFEEVNVNFV